MPRDNDLAYSVASLRNNYELSNLNNLVALSTECVPSVRSTSYKNGMFVKTNQVDSAQVDLARCASASQSSIDR